MTFNEFKLRNQEIVTLPAEVQKSRYDYYEKRRVEKISLLRKERELINSSDNFNSKSLSSYDNNNLISKSKFSNEKSFSNNLNDQLKSFERIKKKQVIIVLFIRIWSFSDWFKMN